MHTYNSHLDQTGLLPACQASVCPRMAEESSGSRRRPGSSASKQGLGNREHGGFQALGGSRAGGSGVSPGREEGPCSRSSGGPGLPSSASGGGRGARGARSRATARRGAGAPKPEDGGGEQATGEAAAGSRLILPGSAGPLAAAGGGWPPGAGPRSRSGSCPRPQLASCARSRGVSGRRPGAPHAPRGARREDLVEAARRQKERERR